MTTIAASDWDLEEITDTSRSAQAPRTRRAAAQPVARTFQGNAALRVIAASIRADVPVLIWGEPGTAKTASLTCMLEAWGYFTQVIIGSIRDSTDMLGLPVEVNGQVIYAPPAWALRANAADKAALLWDEFTTNGSIMAAMLRVIQEKEAGEVKLGKHVRMVAIANPAECSVNGVELAPPMANRFLHVDWTLDTDLWLNGLATNFVNAQTYPLEALTVADTPKHREWVTGLVIGYLRRSRNSISPGVPSNADQASRAWASPRSWTNLMNVMCNLDRSDMVAISKAAEAAVGTGEASAFITYLTAVGLFDPDEVLNDPKIVDWTDSHRVDRLYALTMSVSNLAISRGDKATWVKAMEVLTECHRQGRHDTPVIGLKDLLAHRPEGATITHEQMTRFSDYVA